MYDVLQAEKDAEKLVRGMLKYIGEDPDREGLKDTPSRVVRSYRELFGGYKIHPETLLTTFEDGACDELVLLKDIEFFSFCEHHLLPFMGYAHVAYVPNGKVIGLSKLARLVDVYSRRLQIQERLTQQITAALDLYLQPKGSACVVQAHHSCMSCRGVRKRETVMVTSSLTGVFKEDSSTRAEFMSMIHGR